MTTAEPVYCERCSKPLLVWNEQGRISYYHKDDLGKIPGVTAPDHSPVPVPLSEVTNPEMLCDFCSSTDPVWVYECAPQEIHHFRTIAKYYFADDYREKQGAARIRRTEGVYDTASDVDARWTACEPCAKLIEQRAIPQLVTRVTRRMPAKLVRGKKLVQARGRLYSLYGEFFDTLKLGRMTVEEALRRP